MSIHFGVFYKPLIFSGVETEIHRQYFNSQEACSQIQRGRHASEQVQQKVIKTCENQ